MDTSSAHIFSYPFFFFYVPFLSRSLAFASLHMLLNVLAGAREIARGPGDVYPSSELCRGAWCGRPPGCNPRCVFPAAHHEVGATMSRSAERGAGVTDANSDATAEVPVAVDTVLEWFPCGTGPSQPATRLTLQSETMSLYSQHGA